MVNDYGIMNYKVYCNNIESITAYKTDDMTIYKTIVNGRTVDFSLLDSNNNEIEEKMKCWANIGFSDIID